MLLRSTRYFSTTTRMSTYSRLIRFIPTSSSTPVIGEPVDRDLDVGLASYSGQTIEAEVFSGDSILSPGSKTGKRETVKRILSPVTGADSGTVRCIGLNYVSHAKEMNLAIPEYPTVFFKPQDAIADPFPAPSVLPKAFAADEAYDYEAELALIIGKECKDVSEADALEYLAGYTAANDLTTRKAQFNQSQWCHGKGFDGSCPIGPAFVPKDQIADVSQVRVRGEYNGEKVQESDISDLIFSIPKIISHLSQGTTLKAGTVIITGTPPGVGWNANPKKILKDGDEFRVFVSHGVGTLINKMQQE